MVFVVDLEVVGVSPNMMSRKTESQMIRVLVGLSEG